MSDECDVNRIMARFEKTGLIEHVNEHQGQYGDYSEVQDYQSSLDQVMGAKAMFASLPADLRTMFDNDPGKFLDFATNPENAQEMREMGLLPPQNIEDAPDIDNPQPEPKTAEKAPTLSTTPPEAA